jgi:DNA-binding cell septation regulator SpoVG
MECIEMVGIKSEFLKGIAKVKIPEWGIIISDVKLFKKNDAYWVSLPTKRYEKNGEAKYFSLLQFIDEEKGKQFLNDMKKILIKELEVGREINEQNKIGCNNYKSNEKSEFDFLL